jgi:phage shock protein B
VSIIVEGLLAIVLAGAAAVVVALAVKLFKSLGDGAGRADDARLIQELYRGLDRMEARVETLETILLDRKGRKGEGDQ